MHGKNTNSNGCNGTIREYQAQLRNNIFTI